MKIEYGIRIKWLSVSCFEITDGNVTIVSDPCVTESPLCPLTWESIEKCDFITLSHGHWDHITDIPRLIGKFRPWILTGDQTAAPLARWTNYVPSRIYPMYPDMELDFDSVKIKALYGRHTDLGSGYNDQVTALANRPAVVADFTMNEIQGYGSMEYRNFLYTFPNGTKVLLWGNDPTPDQKNILKNIAPDIAILQYTKQAKDPEAMARFARDIGCKILIPHHMDLKKTKEEYLPEVAQFEKAFCALVPDATFICPENGAWIEL